MLVHEHYCRSALVENTFVLFHFLPDYPIEHRTHNIYDYQTLQKKEYTKIQEMETLKKEELLKEKESFFESLGHDLITPLSLILAPANDMLRETKEDDIQYERLSIITKNAAFLSDLFSTILDFKRVEFSEVKINNRNIEIVSFCRIIVNAFNYLASSKKSSYPIRPTSPPYIYGLTV